MVSDAVTGISRFAPGDARVAVGSREDVENRSQAPGGSSSSGAAPAVNLDFLGNDSVAAVPGKEVETKHGFGPRLGALVGGATGGIVNWGVHGTLVSHGLAAGTLATVLNPPVVIGGLTAYAITSTNWMTAGMSFAFPFLSH